jgi:hypothetical protein
MLSFYEINKAETLLKKKKNYIYRVNIFKLPELLSVFNLALRIDRCDIWIHQIIILCKKGSSINGVRYSRWKSCHVPCT